jgi:cytochrome c6
LRCFEFRNAFLLINNTLIQVSNTLQINAVANRAQNSGISSVSPPLFRRVTQWATGLAIAASVITVHPSLAFADTAEQTFASTCAGCHAGGGNIVRRDATLKLEDLTKYGIDSVDELYNVIYSGKGSMPGYGEGCTPKGACTFGRRLSENDVKDLAEYVLQQAKGGWGG